ncbi:MAG: FHA domain-containing protein [Magnetococcales bacterium]|nr:FHA domain-containing protein [Magnetococcales bacterium]
MAKVIVKFKDLVRQQVTLQKETSSIGRTPNNDIPIENLAVSRRHAEIVRVGGTFLLRDLNSSNGTFINGVRVTEQTLRDGDTVLVGKHTLLFVEDDALAMAIAAAPKSGQDSDTFLRSTMEWEIPGEGATMVYNPVPHPIANPGALLVKAGSLASNRYLLTAEATLIGSATYADVRLTAANAPAVAAVIHHRGAGYSISPSEPGVLLDNRKLITQKPLVQGSQIAIQGVLLEFQANGQADP